ncbi:MAG: alpha/beta hydrolase [Segniliparus sp.]|uniref:alpha/beta hydrolase n=1 Tax=Segniliparus sp. TaxID=2804064 RepID=UPI003F3733A4
MPLPADPEVSAGVDAVLTAVGRAGEPPRLGDVEARRANATRVFQHIGAASPAAEGVAVDHHALVASDGAEIALRWYRPAAGHGQSAVLYLHGGGMIMGWDVIGAAYDGVVRRYVAESGVPMLVVDYRTAPEHPHPTPVEDCYSALVWLAGHAAELGLDTGRIGVMGDSAGGGLAAGVSLMARDRGGPAIAQQLLVYPMLDHRTPDPDPVLAPMLIWGYEDNITGWSALLGENRDAEHGASLGYAAPARAEDLTGLPPAYIDVGDLDFFLFEDLAFAGRLAAAHVPVELHLHPGCPHGFEMFAPEAGVSRRAVEDRVRRIRSL